jgi:hypothetical protein
MAAVMDIDRQQIERTDGCSTCRWMQFEPMHYGSIEFFCARRKEPLSSATLARKICPDFER